MRQITILLLCVMTLIDRVRAADLPALLKFRPAVEIGATVSETTGPRGEPARELSGGPQQQTFTLLIHDHPQVTHQYKLSGRVKYSQVEGDGYLELLNDFGAAGTFFTRTLMDYDPLRKLHGTSDWRDFELPFSANPGMRPQRITLNVVLPGAGQVTVSQPVLASSNPASIAWWSDSGSGILGAILGLIGGTIGILWSIAKSAEFKTRLFMGSIAFGLITLVLGLTAVSLGQPYQVYYPLLLIGSILLFVLGANFYSLKARQTDNELRQMMALDIVGQEPLVSEHDLPDHQA